MDIFILRVRKTPRIFYNAYDIQERLGLGRKNYMTYDDDLILLVCHCLTIIMIGY